MRFALVLVFITDALLGCQLGPSLVESRARDLEKRGMRDQANHLRKYYRRTAMDQARYAYLGIVEGQAVAKAYLQATGVIRSPSTSTVEAIAAAMNVLRAHANLYAEIWYGAARLHASDKKRFVGYEEALRDYRWQFSRLGVFAAMDAMMTALRERVLTLDSFCQPRILALSTVVFQMTELLDSSPEGSLKFFRSRTTELSEQFQRAVVFARGEHAAPP